MKPTSLKKNDKVKILTYGSCNIGIFIERIPRQQGRQAQNIILVKAYAGLDGPDDRGIVVMSDYDVSRRCELA